MAKSIFVICLFTILNSALAETHYAEFKKAFVFQDTNVPEFTYEFEYGSTVKIYCNDNVDINSVFINVKDDTDRMYTIVNNNRVNDEYMNDYQFRFVNQTTVLFTINKLTSLIHNQKFRCLINEDLGEEDNIDSQYNTVHIKGSNNFNNLETKYVNSNPSFELSYPFNSELVIYCNQYDDDDMVHVYITKNNGQGYTSIVEYSEVLPEFKETFGIARDHFRTFRFTMYNLNRDYNGSIVVCTNIYSQSTNFEIFRISGFELPKFDFAFDLEETTLQFKSKQQSELYESTELPYGSRVNVYCNDIASQNVKITVYSLGQQFYTNTIVEDLTVVDEYVNYYEFKVVNDTTSVFTIKDLTSLTDDLSFRCINKLCTSSSSLPSCSESVIKYILIEGYNTMHNTPKYMNTNGLTDTNRLINVTHPFGNEVNYYAFNNVLMIIVMDGVIINQNTFDEKYSEHFSSEPSLFQKYRFTIKNITQELNDVQLIFIVPHVNKFIRNHIIGYNYKPIDEPSCTQPESTAGVITNEFYCVFENAYPMGVLSYYIQYPDGTITDVTNMATSGTLIDDNDFNKNIYELSLDTNLFVDGSVVSCNVTQQIPGNYKNVVKSCSYPPMV